jgi:hypothetical protein
MADSLLARCHYLYLLCYECLVGMDSEPASYKEMLIILLINNINHH